METSKIQRSAAATAPAPEPEKTNYPRYTTLEEHNFYTRLTVEDWLQRQTFKIALRVAKAMQNFAKAMFGLGGVPGAHYEPPVGPLEIDIDVEEYNPKAKCLAADWNSHYERFFNQMQRGAADVHPTQPKTTQKT